MWFLSFIPDSFLHLVILSVLGCGCVLYVLGLFINLFPGLYPYKEPIRILGTILIVAGVYGEGSYANEMSWREKVKEVQGKLEVAQAQSETANSQIQTKIVVQKQVIHDKQIVVQKEIQVNEKLIDKDCRLDPVVIKILNDAASNPFLKPAGDTK